MKQRLSPTSSQIRVASVWRRFMAVLLVSVAQAHGALAQSTGSLDSFISPLKNGLNLIMVFGFIAGCVMVMSAALQGRTSTFDSAEKPLETKIATGRAPQNQSKKNCT